MRWTQMFKVNRIAIVLLVLIIAFLLVLVYVRIERHSTSVNDAGAI